MTSLSWQRDRRRTEGRVREAPIKPATSPRMRSSDRARGVMLAYLKGYRVTEANTLVNPQGHPLHPFRHTTDNTGRGRQWVHTVYVGAILDGRQGRRRAQQYSVRALAAYQRWGRLALADAVVVITQNGDLDDYRPSNCRLLNKAQWQQAHLQASLVARRERNAWRFTPDVIHTIRQRWAAGEPRVALGVEYGVSPSTISRIGRRKLYAWVPDGETP